MSVLTSCVERVVSFFFFFYCYCDHRDLHSFPTRRSSDLSRFHVAVVSRGAGGNGSSGAAGWRVSASSVNSCSWNVAAEDRKSTRLNSSHRCISYAVFCLKKKKKTDTNKYTSTDN